MTKRQEALDNMSNILQANPQMWTVAGDLFVKNMDWPGAQEMAARFRKLIDPKLLEDDKKTPEMQQAEQQIEALTQELNQVVDMLQNVQKSMEAQELQIKAYDAETKRISAVQQSMTPEQIQDIVAGTIAAAMDSGDIMPGNIQLEPMQQPMPEQPMPEQPMGPMV
jgi:septal ring factor EnvC (AmiA/AmiB activator)